MAPLFASFMGSLRVEEMSTCGGEGRGGKGKDMIPGRGVPHKLILIVTFDLNWEMTNSLCFLSGQTVGLDTGSVAEKEC